MADSGLSGRDKGGGGGVGRREITENGNSRENRLLSCIRVHPHKDTHPLPGHRTLEGKSKYFPALALGR